MNTTFDSPSVSSWKRIKLHYISVACGIGLAVAGVVSFISTQPTQQAHSTTQGGISAISSHSSDSNDLTYYLVGSEAELDSLIASAMGDDFLAGHSRIVIIRDLADELALDTTAKEQLLMQMEFGGSTSIVDLRNR